MIYVNIYIYILSPFLLFTSWVEIYLLIGLIVQLSSMGWDISLIGLIGLRADTVGSFTASIQLCRPYGPEVLLP